MRPRHPCSKPSCAATDSKLLQLVLLGIIHRLCSPQMVGAASRAPSGSLFDGSTGGCLGAAWRHNRARRFSPAPDASSSPLLLLSGSSRSCCAAVALLGSSETALRSPRNALVDAALSTAQELLPCCASHSQIRSSAYYRILRAWLLAGDLKRKLEG